jgi:transcriptional regulator with XRE-family HTH domain
LSPYRTITGRTFDATAFSRKEEELLGVLVAQYRKAPDWSDFSCFWHEHLKDALSRVPARERPGQPLYKIAQDLEMRLGIAQGAVAEPDYRDYLADRIEEKFGSRYRFCKDTGIPQAFLSQVLSGKKDFSVETLRRAAKALHLGLALLPMEDLAELPMGDVSAL